MKPNYTISSTIFSECNFIYIFNWLYSNVYGEFGFYRVQNEHEIKKECIGKWIVKYKNQ